MDGEFKLMRSTSPTTSYQPRPLMDCQIVIFDDRPTHAWAPPMDDPEHRQVAKSECDKCWD